MENKKSIYDFSFNLVNKESPLTLSAEEKYVIMIVNTASRCGFTNQYKKLEELWRKYKDRGLLIIAIPTNDFAWQEPLGNNEIKDFCEINYGITFPITEKMIATGKNSDEVFKFIRKNFGIFSGPNWNFQKYIFDKNGKPIDWFLPFVEPDSDKIIKILEENLK